MTTTHRSEERLDGKPSRAVLKAGRREQSLLPSHHIRYIEHHHVPGVSGAIYVITILDNYSRSILASAPSVRQDEDAYLLVLFTAIHLYGAPDVLVSDGGGVFRSNRALAIYER